MRFFALLIAFLVSIALVGCVNHNKDYLKQDKQIGSLVVPPGVPLLKQSVYYPIPKVATQPVTKPVVLTPPTLQKK